MTAKQTQKPATSRALTGDDYKAIAGIIIAIIGLAVGPLYLYLNSLTNRMQKVEERLTAIEVTLGRMDERLKSIEGALNIRSSSGGGTPPPALSVLYTVFKADNSPFSAFSANTGKFSGVWPEFGELWKDQIGFNKVAFLPSPTVTNTVPLPYDFDYLTAIYGKDDPVFGQLIAQGWAEKPLDPYFAQAGYGPFGYSILIAPNVAGAGYLPAFLSGLDKIPVDAWAKWGQEIEATPSP